MALALMAMFSTASAQMDNFLALKFLQQMGGKQNQGAGTGTGGGHNFFNPATMMMGDMGSELADLMMMKHLMGGKNGGQGLAAGGSGGGMFGGMNPLLLSSLDSSDLMMMMHFMGQGQQNQANSGHARATTLQYPGMMSGGYQNPMTNMMMADAMSGNDLFGGSMEGLGAMALMGGMGGMSGGGMMSPYGGMMSPQYGGGMGAYYGAPSTVPHASTGAAAYGYPTATSYASRPTSPRGATQQFMPGMGMGMAGGMGNLMMMDAVTGGDMFQNDLAQDLGGMMMMKNMMQPHNPMMSGGYGGHPMMSGGYGGYPMSYPMMSGGYGGYPYHYAHPSAATATTARAPSATSSASGYASRIQNGGKRGGMYDNLWQMNLMQNLLNPNGGGVSGAGGTSTVASAVGGQPNTSAFNQMAAMEMALGDAAKPIASGKTTKPDQTASASDVGTPADATTKIDSKKSTQ